MACNEIRWSAVQHGETAKSQRAEVWHSLPCCNWCSQAPLPPSHRLQLISKTFNFPLRFYCIFPGSFKKSIIGIKLAICPRVACLSATPKHIYGIYAQHIVKQKYLLLQRVQQGCVSLKKTPTNQSKNSLECITKHKAAPRISRSQPGQSPNPGTTRATKKKG